MILQTQTILMIFMIVMCVIINDDDRCDINEITGISNINDFNNALMN